MSAAVAEGASHPAVAAWLALGTAGLAAVVVAMAWNVNARQIRLAEQLAKRQFPIASGAGPAAAPAVEKSAAPEVEGEARGKKVPPEVIEGPDEVVAGEQARDRIQPVGPHQVVSWAVRGGAGSHGPHPAHPGHPLRVAEPPGQLPTTARG